MGLGQVQYGDMGLGQVQYGDMGLGQVQYGDMGMGLVQYGDMGMGLIERTCTCILYMSYYVCFLHFVMYHVISTVNECPCQYLGDRNLIPPSPLPSPLDCEGVIGGGGRLVEGERGWEDGGFPLQLCGGNY